MREELKIKVIELNDRDNWEIARKIERYVESINSTKFSSELIVSLYFKDKFGNKFKRYYREYFPFSSSYNPYTIEINKNEILLEKRHINKIVKNLNDNSKIFDLYNLLSEEIYRLDIHRLRERKLSDYNLSYEIFIYEKSLDFLKYDDIALKLAVEIYQNQEFSYFSFLKFDKICRELTKNILNN